MSLGGQFRARVNKGAPMRRLEVRNGRGEPEGCVAGVRPVQYGGRKGTDHASDLTRARDDAVVGG